MKQPQHSRCNLIDIVNVQKTFIVLITVIFASLTSDAIAQFSAGEKFLRGSFGFNFSSRNNDGTSTLDDDGKSRQFYFYPAIGVFISDKWAVGGGLGYANSVDKREYQTDFQKYRNYSFSIGLMARRYFEISDKFYFVIEGSLDFSRGTFVDSNSAAESKSKSYDTGITAKPLLVFFPTPRWSVEGGIGSLNYRYSRNLTTDISNSSFGLNHNSTINFGVAYYFRKGA
jgi:hypothetical protein